MGLGLALGSGGTPQRSRRRRSWNRCLSSLDGNARRAIDLREGDKIDAAAFKALIRAAVAANAGKS